MPNKLINISDNIIICLIKGLIFTLPLFFLPWTFEWFEFNKIFLLLLTVPVIAILFFIKSIRTSGKIILRNSPMDIPILVFLLTFLLSAVFSFDKFSSFFGYYGRFSDSAIALFLLVIFYFIIINVFLPKDEFNNYNIFSCIKLLIYSYGVALLTSFFSFLGLWELILSVNFVQDSFNLVGGSLEILASYSVVIIVLIVGMLVINHASFHVVLDPAERINGKPRGFRERRGANYKDECIYKLNIYQVWLFKIILFFALIFLALVDFYIAWICLFLAGWLFLLMNFIPVLAKKFSLLDLLKKDFWLPIILIIISGAFLFLATNNKINLDNILINKELPQTIVLDYKDTAHISFKSLKENFIFGSGPGTFSNIFSLYRDAEYNNSEFWQFRFDKGSSYVFEIIGTLGILGILGYLLVISSFFYLVYVIIKKYFQGLNLAANGIANSYARLVLVIIICLIILILLQFLYLNSISLLFLFFTLLAFLMVAIYNSKLLIFSAREINLKNFVSAANRQPGGMNKLLMICIILLCIGWVVLAGYGIKYWIADFYAKNNDEESLIKAINFNPNRYNYKISLAKSYLNKIKAEMMKPNNFRDNNLIRQSLDNSVKLARAVSNAYPNSVICQETLGMVYRDIRLLTQGSELGAIMAFNQAIQLEPTNPVLLIELGKAYINANMLDKAKQSLNSALAMKSDYEEAKFWLAKIYIKEGRTEEALLILNELAKIYNDTEIFYEQGRLYYNKGDINKAIGKFLKVIEINQGHSNALYSLGLSYELKGKTSEAKKYFEKVLELNPNNEEIIKKLNN